MKFKEGQNQLTAWNPIGINRIKGISIQEHPIYSHRTGHLMVHLDEPGKHSIRMVSFDDLFRVLSEMKGSDLEHELHESDL